MGKTILVTGFGPFGGSAVNPALEAVKRLPESIGAEGCRIVWCEMPVEYQASGPAVIRAIEEIGPDAVVMVGQAAGRASITVERVAVNVDECDAPDNAGEVRDGTPICEGGPDGIFATLPLKAMVGAMRDAGVPADVSDSAGTYVCNHIMYCALHGCAEAGRRMPVGFVHVPLLHEQVLADAGMRGKPSMSVDDIVRGLEAGLGALSEALDAGERNQ